MNNKNKIIFLGTAGEEQVVARQQRKAGGIILLLEGFQFHLEPGPGSLELMKLAKLHPRETIALLATNNSLIRSNDVNAGISAMTLGGLDKHGVFLGSKSVIEGLENEQSRLLPFYKNCVEGLMSFNPRNKIGINTVNIMPVANKQRDETAVGLVFNISDNKIGYTGDTSYFEELSKNFSGVNVLIINCKHPKSITEKGCMNIDDAVKLIEQVEPRIAILTSFGSKLLEKDIFMLGRNLQIKNKVTTIVMAKDGLSINIDDYSDKVKQTTIKGFS